MEDNAQWEQSIIVQEDNLYCHKTQVECTHPVQNVIEIQSLEICSLWKLIQIESPSFSNWQDFIGRVSSRDAEQKNVHFSRPSKQLNVHSSL